MNISFDDMDPRLFKLIRAFQAATSQSLALFIERAALPQPSRWRTAGFPRAGILSGEPPIEYMFHGIGLWLSIGTEEVDFDFGLEGRTGGFNGYWLWNFAVHRRAEFPEFQDRAVVDEALNAAKQAGAVVRDKDGLEYLRAGVKRTGKGPVLSGLRRR